MKFENHLLRFPVFEIEICRLLATIIIQNMYVEKGEQKPEVSDLIPWLKDIPSHLAPYA